MPQRANVAIIVRSFLGAVEVLLDILQDSDSLPSVDVLRPSFCIHCHQVTYTPDGVLWIIGHGTYSRQVLGFTEYGDVVILIRRFLCKGCDHTISVLPDFLFPWRWYAAPVIFGALWLHLVEGQREADVRAHFGIEVEDEDWRTLRRWRTQLLHPLWFWLASRLGCSGPAVTRKEGRLRLQRLHAEAAIPNPSPGAMGVIARLTAGTVHVRGICWPLGHDPPERMGT